MMMALGPHEWWWWLWWWWLWWWCHTSNLNVQGLDNATTSIAGIQDNEPTYPAQLTTDSFVWNPRLLDDSWAWGEPAWIPPKLLWVSASLIERVITSHEGFDDIPLVKQSIMRVWLQPTQCWDASCHAPYGQADVCIWHADHLQHDAIWVVAIIDKSIATN